MEKIIMKNHCRVETIRHQCLKIITDQLGLKEQTGRKEQGEKLFEGRKTFKRELRIPDKTL